MNVIRHTTATIKMTADGKLDPQFQRVLDIVTELGEASPRQVYAASKSKRAGFLSRIVDQLRLLREEGFLEVRRSSERSTDPSEYNLYRVSNRRNHEHVWEPASELGQGQYKCTVLDCPATGYRTRDGAIQAHRTLKQRNPIGQKHASSYSHVPDDISDRPSRGWRG